MDMEGYSAFFNATQFAPSYPLYHSSLLPMIDDKTLSLLAPVAVYWTFTMFFHVLSLLKIPAIEKYAIHTPLEMQSKNKVSQFEVIRAVLVQHVVQTIVGAVFMYFEAEEAELDHAAEMATLDARFVLFASCLPALASMPLLRYHSLIVSFIYNGALPLLRLFVGFFLLDSWQYWFHRYMHTNKTLYKYVHSRHHRLYCPYAFGALYNHPFEGFLLDTLGTGISYKVAGMSIREATFFFAFATAKTVDDHSGYSFPFDPFQLFFSNNAAYHDIHHQSFGIKRNFSQPFFTFWDRVLGTEMSVEQAAHRVSGNNKEE